MNETYDFTTAQRGAVIPAKGKTRITIMLDDAVINAARQQADLAGVGYQTLINSVLREALCTPDAPPQQDRLAHISEAIESLTVLQQSLLVKFDTAFARLGHFVAEPRATYNATPASESKNDSPDHSNNHDPRP